MLLRYNFSVVAFLAATVTSHANDTESEKQMELSIMMCVAFLAIYFLIWAVVGTYGYYNGYWQAKISLLVFFLGPIGLCCARCFENHMKAQEQSGYQRLIVVEAPPAIITRLPTPVIV